MCGGTGVQKKTKRKENVKTTEVQVHRYTETNTSSDHGGPQVQLQHLCHRNYAIYIQQLTLIVSEKCVPLKKCLLKLKLAIAVMSFDL